MATSTVAVIIIGNEILSGRTQDSNLPYIGKRLADLGIVLSEARVVPDDGEAIKKAVNECRAAYDYVFTTGGIGPTHDDITTGSIATAFGVPVERHPDAVAGLKAYYGSAGLNKARLRMADVPAGAALIDNPVSSAPGYRIENVFVMAGVPQIMQAMFDSVCDQLSGGPPILSRTVVSYLTESQLAAGLDTLQQGYGKIKIGSYPFYRRQRFGVSIVLRGTHANLLQELEQEVRDLVRKLGGEFAED